MKYRSFPGSLVNKSRLRLSPAAASALLALFVSLLFQTQIPCSDGFSTSRLAVLSDAKRHSKNSLLPLNSEVQTSYFADASAEDDAVNGLPELTGSLKGSFLKEYELKEHKPLGCSVEESLANEPDGAKHVFVAEVHDRGNAAKAGLRKGDVIVQLSGTFDEVVDVAGLGIEKIRSLVGGRPDENPLIMRVARGTDVMQRHELALVELCIIGDDAATADCISSIYAAEDDVYLADDSEMAMCDEDDGTECMIDSMWSDWSFDEEKEEEEKKEEVEEKPKKVVQPWSSRSSPSGTYVRDPKTGKMVNIDE